MFLFKPYFNIGNLEIHYYAICILLGVIIAVWLGLREAKKFGIPSDVIYIGILICLPLAIVGARLWYVLFNLSSFQNFGEVCGFVNGRFVGLSGLAIQGGVIFALVGIVLYCKHRKVSLYQILDIVAPGFLIGQIFGRWGNFFNQELYGPIIQNPGFIKLFPFFADQMYINGAYRHPVFLYEGTLNLIGLVLILVGRRKIRDLESGDLMAFYLVWYGIVRIPMEVLRLNSGVSDPIMLGDTGIPVSIVTAVLFIIAGVAFFILKRKVLAKIFARQKYIETIELVSENHIDTLIFDLDGTLLDTKTLIDMSFIETFKHFYPEKELTEEELDSFFGPTLKQSFSRYCTDEEKVNEMIEYYRAFNIANHDNIVHAFPGAREMLRTLHGKKYNLAVVSSKKNDLVKHGLDLFGLLDYFDVVLGADDIKDPKPSPEGIDKALSMMKGERSMEDIKKHALYVGDNLSDMEAARNAGIKSCGVLYIKHPEIMLEAKPDMVINKLTELIGICGE